MLKFLIEEVNLNIFSKTYSPSSAMGFRERVLRSRIFRKIYHNELSDLEYCVNHQPFNEGSAFFGRIDICRRIESNSLFIRGWVFNPKLKIKGLNIILNQNRYTILAWRLNRLDVHSRMGFLANSLSCGFVGILEGNMHRSEELRFGFEAVTDEGAITGNFEPIICS